MKIYLPYEEITEVEARDDGVWKVIIGGVVCLNESKSNFAKYGKSASRVAMQLAINNYSLHISSDEYTP